MKELSLVIRLASYVPLRTWYCSKAAKRPVSFATSRPRSVFPNAVKASLDGARMVILVALESDSKSEGLRLRKEVKLDS